MSAATNTRETNEAGPSNREPSPSPRLFTAATPIRFASRGTQMSTVNDSFVMLDPRTVQQWQLDAVEVRHEESKRQTQELAASHQVLREEVDMRDREHRCEIDDIKTTFDKHIQENRGLSGKMILRAFAFIVGFLGGFWYQRQGDLEELVERIKRF